MRSMKDETLSIRTSAEIKQLVRQAAEREHRSIASMIEVLVLAYASNTASATAALLPSPHAQQRKHKSIHANTKLDRQGSR